MSLSLVHCHTAKLNKGIRCNKMSSSYLGYVSCKGKVKGERGQITFNLLEIWYTSKCSKKRQEPKRWAQLMQNGLNQSKNNLVRPKCNSLFSKNAILSRELLGVDPFLSCVAFCDFKSLKNKQNIHTKWLLIKFVHLLKMIL